MKKILCSLYYLLYPINVTKVHIFYNSFMNFAIFSKVFHTTAAAACSVIYFVYKPCYNETHFELETRKIYESK